MNLLALLQDVPAPDGAANTGPSMMKDPVAWLQTNGIEMGLQLLQAIAIFLIGRWVAKMLISVARKMMTKRNLDSTLVGFLCSLGYAALLTLVVIATIDKLGVETTSFAAILAAAGLAVAFALQGTLSNFAAGVMLILFRPFKSGDFVEAGGVSGVVVEVGIFSTIMKTGDNKKIIVPNGDITGGNITNYSANDTRRVDMVFGIGYDDDIKKTKEVLQRICESDDRVLKDPAPVIAVSELADSSVNFICRPWVKTPDYWAVYWAIHEEVKLEFDKAGISIPFPQQDVHMHAVEAGVA